MNDGARALDVFEKTVSQSHTMRCPFDQARYVGQDKVRFILEFDHSKLWLQGGERVVGNLRLGVGKNAQERRFACIGQADDADVGEQFQLQFQTPAHARVTRLAKVR